MNDVLSQNEIDDLLSALSTGEVDVKEIEDVAKEKKIRKYDFTRPDKFAKEHLKTLESIFENYSRLINNFLSGYLRTFIEIEVISTQSMIFGEFSNSIADPALIGFVDFYPLDGQVIYEMSIDLAFATIDRVLGGLGAPLSLKDLRPMTEIELSLLRKMFVKFINLLKEPWSNIIELEPKLESIETSSQFAQTILPTESIALVTLSLKIGDTDGLVNIGLPHYVLEPILPKLSSRLWVSNTNIKELSDEEKQSLQDEISKSEVGVNVEIGKTQISVLEFLSLKKGDILILNKNVEKDLRVFVGDELKFLGTPGSKKDRVAVKITKSFQEGVD